MADCQAEKNARSCNCTYEPCGRKGRCCDCLAYHRAANELPACFFDAAAERTYDRSTAHFLKRRGNR